MQEAPMFPWLWVWAPQTHFPWSGAVTQDIAPEAFFNAIPPSAGDGRLEHEAFELASYGRQLGWITEVLLAQAGEHDAASPQLAAKSLQKLKQLQGGIEALKSKRRYRLETDADAALTRLAQADPDGLQRVLRRHAASVALPAESTPTRRIGRSPA